MLRRPHWWLLLLFVASPALARLPLDVDDLVMKGVRTSSEDFDLGRLRVVGPDVRLSTVKPALEPALDGQRISTVEADYYMKSRKLDPMDLWMTTVKTVAESLDVRSLQLMSLDYLFKGITLSEAGLDLARLRPVAQDGFAKSWQLTPTALDLAPLEFEAPNLFMKKVGLQPFDFEL